MSRIHIGFGSPEFDSGYALVAEELEPNSGYLLTQGFNSQFRASAVFHLCTTHLYDAGMRTQTIDDRFSSLCRAFEGLAKEYGLSSQDLKSQLGLNESATVRGSTIVLCARA